MIRRSIILAAAAAVLAHGLAHAQARFGVDLQGGLSRYAMTEMNDSLSSFNERIGTQLGTIREGPAWGLALRFWPDPRILLRLEFERLRARSQDSGLSFDVSADAYTLSVAYFPPTERAFRYGFGLGLGPCFTRGELAGRGASLEATGDGFGGRVTAEALQSIGSVLSLQAVVGFRLAAVNGIEFEGAASDLRSDYSGAFFRIGLAAEGVVTPRYQFR